MRTELTTIEDTVGKLRLPVAVRERILDSSREIIEEHELEHPLDQPGLFDYTGESNEPIFERHFKGVVEPSSKYWKAVVLYDRLKQSIVDFAEERGYEVRTKIPGDINRIMCEDRIANFFWGEYFQIFASDGKEDKWDVHLKFDCYIDNEGLYGDFRVMPNRSPPQLKKYLDEFAGRVRFRKDDKEIIKKYHATGDSERCNYCGDHDLNPPRFRINPE